MTTTQKTAVIYARQSFGLEEGSVSLSVQIENCKGWAKRNNIAVIGVFSDANTSSELYPATADGIAACNVDRGFLQWKKAQKTKGRNEYKVGLGECFEKIKECKPTYIICNTANRLGRSATNSNLNNFITAFLMEQNCSIVDVASNSITDFSDRLMMAFRAMKDALDYQGLEEKRRSSIESIHNRINSFKVVSNAFAVVTKKDGTITFDLAKAEVVKYVYNAMVEGETYAHILGVLNNKYRKLANGKQWYCTNIPQILGNLVYCGYAKNTSGDVARAINIPEPIISFSLYQQAQKIAATKKKGYQKYNIAGQEKRHWLPYSGYLYCDCGRKLQMRLDDGVVYHCINPDGHAVTLRTNALNNGQDMYLTLQALFITKCISSRKALEASKAVDSNLDSLNSRLDSLQKSLKAKFRLVENDDDYEIFKDEISQLKQQIAELKQEIIIATERKTENLGEITARLEADFAAIMQPRLLDENSYQRLLAETFKKITVKKDALEITLFDGNTFELPRITVNGRGKKTLPWSEIFAETESVENLAITHYTIYFHGNENKTLLETADYSIMLTAE